ncbi:MAG: sugar O-acetyltransferase, partial [Romboutsia sp.]|nr:sugar O-acetyltransferase [Romboutsia sp.]
MSEKEKMLAGMLYDANNDTNLLKERMLCKDMRYEYNNLKPSDIESQDLLIKKLLGKTKDKFCIIAPFWCDYG